MKIKICLTCAFKTKETKNLICPICKDALVEHEETEFEEKQRLANAPHKSLLDKRILVLILIPIIFFIAPVIFVFVFHCFKLLIFGKMGMSEFFASVHKYSLGPVLDFYYLNTSWIRKLSY